WSWATLSSTAITYLFCSGPVSTLCSAPVQVSCGSIPHIPGASLPCRSQFRQIRCLAIDLVFRFVSNERHLPMTGGSLVLPLRSSLAMMAALAGGFLAFSTPAHAELRICNETANLVSVAL